MLTPFVSATHIQGGNITYQCVGPNEYEITLTLTADCGATPIDTSIAQIIQIKDDCGSTPYALNLSHFNTEKFTPFCDSIPTECDGGTYPGWYIHTFKGTTTLPSVCDSWTFYLNSCCRYQTNNSNTNGSYYYYAKVNTVDAPFNISPVFTGLPFSVGCYGQTNNFNFGVTEIEGDSLVYSLVDAWENENISITYNPTYTGAQPISGISINSQNGDITYNANSIGSYIVVVKVDEYRNGILIGTVIRDVVFEVLNCNNSIPYLSSVTPNNNATQIQNDTIIVCEGIPFDVNVVFADSNALDSITIYSNYSNIYPGAQISYTGTNPSTANLMWTLPTGYTGNGSWIYFDVKDDACPIIGHQTYSYYLQIEDSLTCLNSINEINSIIFNVYPNPNNGKFRINLKQTTEELNLIITNNIGQVVLKEESFDMNNEIDLSKFNKGVFFITLSNESYQSTKKIIIDQ